MAELRIPRLAFSWKARIVQVILLNHTFLVLAKKYAQINHPKSSYTNILSLVGSLDKEISTREKSVYIEDVINQGGHLFGQHTVRLSPISTAKLNPSLETFCLEPTSDFVLVPVVFNNTRPAQITYSIASLDNLQKNYITLSLKELKQIEKTRIETQLDLQKVDPVQDENSEDDYYDLLEAKQRPAVTHSGSLDSKHHLEKTEVLQHIKVTHPGTIRLEKALDQGNTEIRIGTSEVTIVDCPRVELVPIDEKDDGMRCIGTTEIFDLKVYGMAPLTLKWHREVSGRKESFTVEGIEGDHDVPGRSNAQNLHIPLKIQLDTLGKQTYALDGLADGAGNSLDLTVIQGTTRAYTSHSVTVLRRSAMSFAACGPGRPTSLLIGKEAPLSIIASELDLNDGPWNVTIKYNPPANDKRSFKSWQQDFTTLPGKRDLTLLAKAPGEYTIVKIQGQHCPGDILSPETCRVVEQPLPTAEVEWKRIHECSGDTGVLASLLLQGKPPFKLFYSTQRDGEPIRELSQVFHGSRGEISLQPEKSGTYTYTFLRMNDANYKDIKLDGPTINQVVHPLASATFVKSGDLHGKEAMHSCSGSMVDIDVDLKGTAPWALEVQILGPKTSQNVRVENLSKSRETLRLPIPSVIDKEGGTFQVDLVSVEDSYGCKRQLSVPGVSIDVKRIKPTAKFYAQDGQRRLSILQGKRALLPLRLTGDGPWRIKYRRQDDPEAGVMGASLSAPNDYLSVTEAGLYEILEVKDAFCTGSVAPDENTFVVEWVPRPAVQIANTTEVFYSSKNGTYIRPAVNLGIPPFQLNYNVAREVDSGGIRLIDQPTFSSIQTSARFQLQTSKAGRVYYEVQAIGDASYPIQKHSNVIPHSKRLHFEQQVFPRPSAYFTKSNRMSFCLNDPLVQREDQINGVVALDGIPPFRLELSIKDLASSEIYREIIETSAREWMLNVPRYIFHTVGPHLVTIDSVMDDSLCPQSDVNVEKRTLWIDVAETAVIVPFERKEDYCIGEPLQFQLEGSPPWRVQYNFNEKLTTVQAFNSPFRRVADRPGVFSVVSIAHEHDLCQNTVTGMDFRIHNIPSAKVSHGRKVIQDIREGEQAEINFELVGEPPFTFTYQRFELSKGQKKPKVLESHTVSGVTTKNYSIYSAAEGTWTVSFIQDKYCRYPPMQVDKAIEDA
ncbi:hypothetical protein Clacol_007610 [Clathrus columnatus]|uniref:Uncharacterized protein n=1 Tax=Clathrus columnatus TaxID=1419009 RepID=A0AAV5AJS5_9AGAM|nr:hypothetical protein Clacol_007610 [Clathrus columnatus]